MKNEGDVKKAVKKIFQDHGVFFYMPVQNGMGNNGIADFIACCRGVFIAVETKFGYNKPTFIQQEFLDGVDAAQGVALVINEDNLDLLEGVLKEITTMRVHPAYRGE